MNTETDIGTRPCERKAEIRVKHLEAKELQRLPANQQKLEERHGADSPFQSTERAKPADTFMPGFQNWEEVSSATRFVVYYHKLWSISFCPQKLIQIGREQGFGASGLIDKSSLNPVRNFYLTGGGWNEDQRSRGGKGVAG